MADGQVEELAELRERVAIMERDARVLRELATNINAAVVLDELFALVTRTVDETFGFRHAMVLLFDSSTSLLEVAASRGYDDPGIGATVKLGFGAIGMAGKKKRVMRVTGLRQRRSYAVAIRQRMQAAGTAVANQVKLPGLDDAESQIAIPMLIGERLIGVLSVESTERDVFGEGDEVLVATIANHFGAAIENVRHVATLEDRVQKRTEQLETVNDDLRQTQAQLVQAGKMASLGNLVAGVAHEINTPIASVASSNETLVTALQKLRRRIESEGLAEAHPKIARLVGAAEQSGRTIGLGADRVGEIVKRLRSFARLDEADLQRTDLHAALEDTIALVRHELNTITLKTELADDLPEILCFARQLNQVFLNLMVNAIHAVDAQGTITLRTRAVDPFVEVEVEDDGTGISADHLGKIFDPGFTTKGVGVGTGLGLSISYRIVQDHGGEVRVRSELGKGTTFTVRVPIEAQVPAS